MGAQVKLGASFGSGAISYPAGIVGNWTVIHGNLTDTAESASVLVRPSTYASAYVYPARVHEAGARLLLRMRHDPGVTNVATAPKVRIYGAYGPDASFTPSSGVFLDDGTITWVRLDNNAAATAPSALTFSYSGMRDSTYRYSDLIATDGYELRGCKWVVALVETAAATFTGGSSTVIELMAAVVSVLRPVGVLAGFTLTTSLGAKASEILPRNNTASSSPTPVPKPARSGACRSSRLMAWNKLNP